MKTRTTKAGTIRQSGTNRQSRNSFNRTSKRSEPLRADATWNMRGAEIIGALDEMARTCSRDAQRLELIGEWNRAGKAERLAGQLAVLAEEAREVFAREVFAREVFANEVCADGKEADSEEAVAAEE